MEPPKNLKFIFFLAAIVIVMITLAQALSMLSPTDENGDNGNGTTANDDGLNPLVKSVTDGDTFTISTGEKVRLLCINTPETGQAWSKEAKDVLTEFLSMDDLTMESSSEDKDGSGRLLRYVFVRDENWTKLHVNLEMVRAGYANAYVFSNSVDYKDEFFAAEKEARENESGFWAPSPHNVTIVEIHQVEGYEVSEEYILFRNDGSEVVNLEYWTIKDQWTQYTFPYQRLDPGQELYLHTGTGMDSPTDLYWDREWEVWGDWGDAAYLRDSGGLMVDFMEYGDRVIY